MNKISLSEIVLEYGNEEFGGTQVLTCLAPFLKGQPRVISLDSLAVILVLLYDPFQFIDCSAASDPGKYPFGAPVKFLPRHTSTLLPSHLVSKPSQWPRGTGNRAVFPSGTLLIVSRKSNRLKKTLNKTGGLTKTTIGFQIQKESSKTKINKCLFKCLWRAALGHIHWLLNFISIKMLSHLTNYLQVRLSHFARIPESAWWLLRNCSEP